MSIAVFEEISEGEDRPSGDFVLSKVNENLSKINENLNNIRIIKINENQENQMRPRTFENKKWTRASSNFLTFS